jgi:hypothetical protein
MMESSPPTQDDVEARFVPSQKGTMLLRDENNFNHRIHKKNMDGTKAYYKCVKKDSAKCLAMAVLHIASSKIVAVMHEHVHEPNILHKTARTEEKRMIAAASLVGLVSTVEVMSKIKTNLELSDILEATR